MVAAVVPLKADRAFGMGAGAGCGVSITRFAFTPSTATEGSPVVLRLAVRNCTKQAQTVTLTRFGTEPPGCPVIDPIARSVTIAARSTYTQRTRMTAGPCVGTEQFTERVSRGSTQLAEATADLSVTAR
ncbi:MAG: hypothetical protein JO148_16255 [Acidimicrobiia bacterium]|nr:hypothetical protein [Acidimicrobiia bacterium]